MLLCVSSGTIAVSDEELLIFHGLPDSRDFHRFMTLRVDHIQAVDFIRSLRVSQLQLKLKGGQTIQNIVVISFGVRTIWGTFARVNEDAELYDFYLKKGVPKFQSEWITWLFESPICA